MHDFYLPSFSYKDFNVYCVDYLDYRVVISENAKNKLISHYKANNVDLIYSNRIVKIENAVEIDNSIYLPKLDNEITIGYVGRWSEEKRNDIFIQIATAINKKHKNVKFIMAGIGMKSNLKKINEAGVMFLGEITDENELMKVYKTIDFLLITSLREGFPMVIMESMTQGVIPITTNVGGIKEHIINEYNGILIENKDDENAIVNDFLISIETLLNSKEKRAVLSKNAYLYSRLNFKIEDFNLKYLNIFFKQFHQ
jgi:glycosyltransferase involved in cell wall biosynthesis